MNLFGDCPLKGNEVTIKSGPLAGASFEVEDWARNVMAKKIDWPQDLGNPAVHFFWRDRKDLLKRVLSDGVEYVRLCLTGLYGHIGYSGHLVMLDELDCAATMRKQEVTNAELDFQIRDNWRLTSENEELREFLQDSLLDMSAYAAKYGLEPTWDALLAHEQERMIKLGIEVPEKQRKIVSRATSSRG